MFSFTFGWNEYGSGTERQPLGSYPSKYAYPTGSGSTTRVAIWFITTSIFFWRGGICFFGPNTDVDYSEPLDPDPVQLSHLCYLKLPECKGQGVTNRCRLSLLTKSALVIRVQMRAKGGVAGSKSMGTAVHITWHGAQINFGDLPPYLTYGKGGFPWVSSFVSAPHCWWWWTGRPVPQSTGSPPARRCNTCTILALSYS